MERRAKLYRALVVVVIVLALTAAVVSAVVGMRPGLAIAVLLVPAVAAHLLADQALIGGWRSRRADWYSRGVPAVAVRASLEARTWIPKSTVAELVEGGEPPRYWRVRVIAATGMITAALLLAALRPPGISGSVVAGIVVVAVGGWLIARRGRS